MFGQLALAHEFGQRVWAEAGFVHLLGRSRGGVHGAHFRPVGNAGRPAVLGGDRIAVLDVAIQNVGEHLASGIWRQRDLANSRRAVRTIISTDPSSGTASSACRISSMPYPSSTSAARTSPRADRSSPEVVGPSAPHVGRSNRAFNSSKRRAAVFFPTPGMRHRVSMSSSRTAVDNDAGDNDDRMAKAKEGPTPW